MYKPYRTHTLTAYMLFDKNTNNIDYTWLSYPWDITGQKISATSRILWECSTSKTPFSQNTSIFSTFISPVIKNANHIKVALLPNKREAKVTFLSQLQNCWQLFLDHIYGCLYRCIDATQPLLREWFTVNLENGELMILIGSTSAAVLPLGTEWAPQNVDEISIGHFERAFSSTLSILTWRRIC